MNGLIKTLIGDLQNVAVVSAILGVTAALELSGHLQAAWLVMPVLTLSGVAWLARR